MAKTPSRNGAGRQYRLAHSRALRLVLASGLVDDLVRGFSQARGRPIELVPFDLGAGSPTGLWVATRKADYIVFPVDASSSERTAIICHEVAHMVLEHQAEAKAEGESLSQLTALVAPNVDPSVARQFLTRHGYTDSAEAEAEKLGTVLVAQLTRNAETHALRADPVSDRLR